MSRRSKLEIYMDLLSAITKETKITHIGRRANLSWKDTQRYLKLLNDMGLVLVKEAEDGKNKYELTDKGLRTLNYLKRITSTLSPRVQQII